jgi:hypothetical protein
MSEKSKITFKSVPLKPEKFLKVINPDMELASTDGILYWNTGIYGSKLDNAFPDFIIDLYINGASVHQNLVNLKSNLILGNNLQPEKEDQSNTVNQFLTKRNKSEDNLKSVYAKCAKDMALFNGAVIQVIYNREGKIAECYHLPMQDFRISAPNKFGRSEWGYISKSWGYISNSIKSNRKEYVKIRLWDPQQWQKYPTQLLFMRDYGYTYYPVPAYNSAINYIILSREISDFHVHNVRSNFFLSGLLTQLKGSMSDEDIENASNEIEQFYSGVKGRKVLLAFVDDMANKPDFQLITGGEQDKLFDILSQQVYQNIITAHNASPLLVGVDSKGSDLGGSANKMNVSVITFVTLVTEPMKQVLLDGINKILVDVNNLGSVICTTEPLKTEQPIADGTEMTVNERRAWLYGLPNLDNSSNAVNNPNTLPT